MNGLKPGKYVYINIEEKKTLDKKKWDFGKSLSILGSIFYTCFENNIILRMILNDF